MIAITLDPQELAEAYAEGAARHHRRRAATPLYGQPRGESQESHRIGMAAERAVCVALGVEWVPTPTPDRERGDVAGCQVRSTKYPDGHLPVHPDDPNDWPLILVITAPPEFRIVGGIRAAEGKRAEWWRQDIRCPCWMVPQSALRPIRRTAT